MERDIRGNASQFYVAVKTFLPGNRTCSVEMKAGRDFGPSFLWVLAGIPSPEQDVCFEYYIIPSKEMALNVSTAHKLWLEAPGAKGQPHVDSRVRIVHLPPSKSRQMEPR